MKKFSESVPSLNWDASLKNLTNLTKVTRLIYKEFFAPFCYLCNIPKINLLQIKDLAKKQNVTSMKSNTYNEKSIM